MSKGVIIKRTWLETARKNKKLTMKQLAEELHISESYYCSIENGQRKRQMGILFAKKISDVLEISLSQIIDFEQQAFTEQHE